MNALKAFAKITVCLVLLLIASAYFAAVEKKYKCVGEFSKEGRSTDATIYIELNQYRWWVGLWSDSDGDMVVEAPSVGWGSFYPLLKESGNRIRIHEISPEKYRGDFSTFSGSLTLVDDYAGTFKGECTRFEL